MSEIPKIGRAKDPGPTFKPVKRKNIRLPANRYIGRQMYFFTLCFHERRCFGADANIASRLIAYLRESAASCGFAIHAYCVMPDHMHFLADGLEDSSNGMKLVEAFKQATAFDFLQNGSGSLWQFKYYDHILRPKDSPDAVAWYIWMNPVRKGLCGKPADYPYVGAFSRIGMSMLNGAARTVWEPPWKAKGEGATGKQMKKAKAAGLKTPALRVNLMHRAKGSRAEGPGPTVTPNA